MENRGQAQNLETILVIIIITMILGIALIVFTNFNTASLETQRQQFQQQQSLSLLHSLPQHPQLQYTELGYDKAAVDATKLLSTNLTISGRKKIAITQLYPEKPEALCSLSSYPECNTYILYSNLPPTIRNQEIISLPLNLYHPKTKQQGFALLTITTYT